MKIQSIKGPLQELGLSDGAEKTYVTLIRKGIMGISEISRSIQKFRKDVYVYIHELITHDLVKIVKNGKRSFYKAVSPENIFVILKNKEDKIAQGVQDLLSAFDNKQEGLSAETYTGKQGISIVYEKLVKDSKKNAKLYRLESPRDYQKFKKYYPKAYWNKASVRYGGTIDKFVITNKKTNTARRQSLNRFAKTIPESYEPFDHNISTLIIENKVAFLDFDHEQALLIENARFASYMKIIFKMLFEKLK